MNEIDAILAEIRKQEFRPIYVLMGDETYYIDLITAEIKKNTLKEEERAFNEMVCYARDTSVEDVVSSAKRYPMMSARQLIIVKEAQDWVKTIDQMAAYAANPQPSTVLVLNYKYKILDKRKAFYKAVSKSGAIVACKSLFENKVAHWIHDYLKQRQYDIVPKAAQMLVEFLGNDLSKIVNELEKLELLLPKGHQITPEDIETNIGISKDFNVFELRNAIGYRQLERAYQIAAHFAENPKMHPLVLTTGMLFSYFSQIMQYHVLNDHSPRSVASALGINPFFVKDYAIAAGNYPMKYASRNIALLREYDLKGKGVGAREIADGDLLKELVHRLMH
jgi:DNA polymerase-3 subunit delta